MRKSAAKVPTAEGYTRSSSPDSRIAIWWAVLSLFASIYLVGPFCSMLDAQSSMLAQAFGKGLSERRNAGASSSASREWIDGTHDLIARVHRLVGLSTQVGAGLKPAPTERMGARDLHRLQVGDQRKFYATDFARSGSPYSTNATCRAVGKFCYIFVEDEQWQRGSVTHTDLVKLKRAFDESTPANPARGIYELETENLGPPPDEIDLDPKIYILVLDIPDNYRSSGSYIAGYFEPVNQKRGVVRDPNTGVKFYSNEVEMIYIDADPLDLGSVLATEILAHEFQHLIHWRHDPNEDLWINEGCSDYAALFLCGYGTDFSWHVEAFESEPQASLVYWPGGLGSSMANYGAAYLWMVYLHEHYGGVSTISSLIANPANGIHGINDVLSARGYSQDFEDVFSDWKIANFLDDTSLASGNYGYSSLNLRVKRGSRHFSFPVSNISRYVQSWAADYVEFTGGDGVSDLQIDFVRRNPAYDFDVKAIAMKNEAPVAVESMQFQEGIGSSHISIPEFGYAVDTVVLVTNWQPRAVADFDEVVSYSYSARLGREMSFDVVVLPNAVHDRYVDIVVQLGGAGASSAGIPRITVTRLGKALVSEQNMVPISSLSSETGLKAGYVYQLYIPHGWDRSEVRWDIYCLSRWVTGGDLGAVQIKL